MSLPAEDEDWQQFLDKLRGDINSRVVDLIHEVIHNETPEPNTEEREELADLLRWHLKCEAAKEGASDDDLTRMIEDMDTRFRNAKVQPGAHKRHPYRTLIKHWEMKKNKITNHGKG